MAEQRSGGGLAWGDACLAAALCAVAPRALGGIHLRARHGPTRDAWRAGFRRLMGKITEQRVAADADDGVLFGGLDIAASLAAGRAIVASGVLARVAGGLLVIAGAERCDDAFAARIAATMDRPVCDTSFAVLALDEGDNPDERAPDGLVERLALRVDLEEQPSAERTAEWPVTPAEIIAARRRFPAVTIDDAYLDAICETAAALGIVSLRAPLAALVTARAAAALDDRAQVGEADVAVAARLVLGPRARQYPTPPSSTTDEPDEPDEASDDDTQARPADSAPTESESNTGEAATPPETANATPGETQPSDSASKRASNADAPNDEASEATPAGNYSELMLEAAGARINDDMLAEAGTGQTPGAAPNARAGRRGVIARASGTRGRPVGTRAGLPDDRHRLDVMATLRAAAPWQTVRGRTQASPRLRVRADDFRVRRHAQVQETATLFVVDASGSSALHRLAETKGAIELLLVDCYVRRDRVGLIAFRGTTADTLLPPTRSLTRARRALAGLPGGGPTPLACGLDAALHQAGLASRDGLSPRVVILTDGRGNIARDGRPGRAAAERDTEAAARAFRAAGHAALLVDTSPRPRPAAERLAEQLGARYLPLPLADATRLSDAVRTQAGA
ncbi:VWA domain-containing protein [Salinisphaera sp. Q1T1-3]|uniref:VWA domain-containing protein n=1 Tax=Salinisphaera sp. Q1T1-3 TaxID=2321229 RepID=UPI000E74AB25|nr:VWA domain-containing protein [Salinisphaera sp. Q1T1-3]RJS92107.1 VWA domain-containing protein [Salinisphaera sp. Q1T1-3]